MARPSGSNRGRLLLVMLIVSSLLLITLDLRGVGVVSGIRSGVGTALTPVEKVGNWVVSPFKNFFSDLIHLGRTGSTIKNLKAENAKLRAEIVQQQNSKGQAKQLQAALDLAGRANWKTISAKVMAQGSTISFTHTVTIDQGSRAGIKPNLTVINGSGLVGVVKSVYPNSSVVLLASDPSFKIGVRVARNQSIGILSGQGSNSGILELLDNTEKLKKNDILISRGSNNNSPFVAGVPVGIVKKSSDSTSSVSQVADVSFYANLNALGVVSVILSASDANPGNALIPKAPAPTAYTYCNCLCLSERLCNFNKEVIMWRREVTLSLLTFSLLFLVQEGFENQIHLPLGGFSLILLAALIWASISEPRDCSGNWIYCRNIYGPITIYRWSIRTLDFGAGFICVF
jgi:rod shape-determining protein MreC